MPVALLKAELTSSMAFFIDAAAKTVMVCSSARAGSAAKPNAHAPNAQTRNARLRKAVLLGRKRAPATVDGIGLTSRNRRSGHRQRTHGALQVKMSLASLQARGKVAGRRN